MVFSLYTSSTHHLHENDVVPYRVYSEDEPIELMVTSQATIEED